MQAEPHPAPAGARRADVRDMAIVHQVYRQEFALAPQILHQLRSGEQERRGAAAEWFGVMLLSMHHHHVAEDGLLYPLLQGLVSRDLLDHMEHQHHLVEAAVDMVQTRLGAWERREPGSADALAAAYEALTAVLIPHLDDEERDIVPVIGDYLTAQEYGRMATAATAVTSRGS